MTAQEAADKAAQKGRSAWSWLKGHRTSIVICAVGVSTLAASVSYEQLNHIFLRLTGGGTVALNVISWLSEHFSKATGREVKEQISQGMADDVAERIYSRFGSIEQAIKDSNSRRDEMHQENRNDNRMIVAEVHQIKEGLEEHGEAIDHIGKAVQSLKPDWQPRQVGKGKG